MVTRAQWVPLGLALGAIVLRLGAFFAPRHLSLDDGAYGVSIIDMRHGLLPYRDLFSSQGPLHYPLLYVGDLLGLRWRNAPRVVPMFAGALTPVAMWGVARRLGAKLMPAFIAAAIVATTGSMLWTTGTVSADGPVAALTLFALWTAVLYRDRAQVQWVVATGLLVGAAIATKPLMFPALIPIAWWCAQPRRWRQCVVGALVSIAVWFAAALPWGLGRVWQQSIRFHLDKHGQSPPWTQFGKLVTTLAGRDLVLCVAVVLAVVTYVRTRPLTRNNDVRVIAIWTFVLGAVLIFQKLLLVSHVAAFVLPLALLIALRPPPLRWFAYALVIAIPVQVYQLSDFFWPGRYDARSAHVVAQIRALPRGALAISDIGGLVWQAGRSTPRQLNDNSSARISTGRETTATVLTGANDPRTCAVAIWSFRWGEELPGLREGLVRAGYRLALNYNADQQLWLKTPCAVPSRQVAAAAARARSRD